jgi:hypothetical protein
MKFGLWIQKKKKSKPLAPSKKVIYNKFIDSTAATNHCIVQKEKYIRGTLF